MKCVIIGSFRKHHGQIQDHVRLLKSYGVEVLSPKEAAIINPQDSFVLLSTDDKHKGNLEIELDVLRYIDICDFVLLVNSDGYLGVSASFEIGYAFAKSKTIYKTEEDNGSELILSLLNTWDNILAKG